MFDYSKPDRVFLLLLGILALWLYIPGLSADRIMLPMPDDFYTNSDSGYRYAYDSVISDANLEYQPWNDYACERLKNGEMPFWNPYNLCGTPFYANSLQQLTYIPRLVASLILPSQNVLTVMALLHFLLTGIGAYYLLKAYNVGPVAAGLGAFVLLFKFSHPAITVSPPLALTLAFTPLCLLLLIKIIRGGPWLFALYLAIALSCAISSGYPVYTVHLLYLGVALMLFEFFRLRDRTATSYLPFIKILTAFVFSILFSLGQIIPTGLFYSLSARPDLFGEHFIPFWNYPSFLQYVLYQNFFFSPSTGNQSVLSSFEPWHLYLGVAPLLLTLPFFGQWREKPYRFFMIGALITGMICFWVPVSTFAFNYLPGFGITPLAPLPIFFFCTTMAFGISLGRLLRPGKIHSTLGTWAFIGTIVIFCAIPPLQALHRKIIPQNFSPNYILFIGSSFFVLLAILLKNYEGKIKPLAWIASLVIIITLLPIMKILTTFEGPEGSWALRCKAIYGEFERASLDAPRYFNGTGSPILLSNTNIYPRVRLVQGYDSLILRKTAEEYQRFFPTGVFEGRRLLPVREEVPKEFVAEAGIGGIIINPLYVKSAPTHQIADITLELKTPDILQQPDNLSIQRTSPERFEIDFKPGHSGSVSISEAYYPAWRYRIDDGKSRKVGEENGFITITDIPDGPCHLTLFYDPRLEYISLGAALVFFFIGLALIMFLDRRERRKISSLQVVTID